MVNRRLRGIKKFNWYKLCGEIFDEENPDYEENEEN